MKKIISKLLILSIAIFALNACGGGATEPKSHTTKESNNDIEAIYLTDLPSGYQLNGYVESGKKAGEVVKLIYCPDYRYSYYRGNENFNGKYEIKIDRDEVAMIDDDGGSYALQAQDGLFEVGKSYNCRDLTPLTSGVVLTKILPHNCPNHQ